MNWIKRLIGSRARRSEPPAQAPVLPSPKPPPAVYTRYAFSDPSLRIAAVGDLHGRIDLLQRLGARLDALSRDRSKRLVEIYLGDYIDRGGNASAVIEFLHSLLLAPVRMLFHTQFVIGALTGWRLDWKSPPRDDAATPSSNAITGYTTANQTSGYQYVILDPCTGSAGFQ